MNDTDSGAGLPPDEPPAGAPDPATRDAYAPLDVQSLPRRLGTLPALSERLAGAPQGWRVREVGDGNLNLVFIVEGARDAPGACGAVIVKQALPYVRLVGDSWPLPLSRSFFEYHALTRQAARSPDTVPEVLHFDRGQALIVMQFLTPHRILRQSLMDGTRHDGLGDTLGRFCAETLFRGSDLSMAAAERKRDVALFAGNAALCDITENLVFDEPYFDAPLNGEIPAGLQPLVDELRDDVALKIAAQQLKSRFANHAETLLHGDLHTGSIMVHADDARVIDPEFALYGPMGLDIGMLLANFTMAWFAQPGHAVGGDDRAGYRVWIEGVMKDVWERFVARFSELWHGERTGMLYPARLFEDRDQAADAALALRLEAVWRDTLGFAGVEIHRRTIGLARIVEYESIEDVASRVRLQGQGLRFGRELVLEAESIDGIDALLGRMRVHGESGSTDMDGVPA